MKKYLLRALLSLLLLPALPCRAQVPVILAPLPQLQFFLQNGQPNSFGCVFTYASNSTTPLATYTDYTGNTQNANPVVLSAGGSANIWIQTGLAYAFKVKSSGGVNCASGATIYTVNGIGGGISIVTTVVPFSGTPTFTVSGQNQLFEMTLTGNVTGSTLSAVGILSPGIIFFQLTQDGTGGHTFVWPANVIGGCTIGSVANQVTTQEFVWNGTNATATGPCVTGTGPDINAGSLSLGASQTASTFTGTAGTSLATTSGTFNLGDGVCVNATFDFIDCGPGTPVKLFYQNGTSTTVHANTATAQVIKTVSFGAGALNVPGKTFRISGDSTMLPTASAASSVGFTVGGAGNGMNLGSQISSMSDYVANGEAVCIVITTGASGAINCEVNASAVGQASGGALTPGTGVYALTGIDLTGTIAVTVSAGFTSASASNSATNVVFTVETLN